MPRSLRALALLTLFLAGGANAGAPNPLACNESPFGTSLMLQANREPTIGLVGRFTPGALASLGYQAVASIPYNNPPANFTGLDARLTSWTEITSVALDLNGDGEDEVAYAGITPSGVAVAVVNKLGVVDAWFRTGVAASQIQVGAADLVGAKSGRKQLVLAWREGFNAIVIGLFGNASGGLQQPDNGFNMVYTRLNTVPQRIALATGDFLLDGSDQVALLVAGKPGGIRKVFFDVIRYKPGTNLGTPDATSFSAGAFTDNAAMLGDNNETTLALEASSMRWIPGQGVQVGLVLQSETQLSSYPLEYWMSAFTGVRAGGVLTGMTRADVVHTAGASFIVQTRPGRYELAAADLNRDGIEELLLAYPNESQDTIGLRAYRYTPVADASNVKMVTYADFSYASARAEDVNDIAVAAGDIDGDGFPELVTAATFNNSDYELRHWDVRPISAEVLGAGCGVATVGTAPCPRTTFAPAPDLTDAPISGRGATLSGFVGDDAAGTWTLCAADSEIVFPGTLERVRLFLNRPDNVFSSDTATLAIPDGKNSLEACKTIIVPPPEQLIASLEVEVTAMHGYVGDLTLELTSPRGRVLTLLNRPGRTGAGFGADARLALATPIRFSDVAPTTNSVSEYFFPSPNGSIYTQTTLAMPDYDNDSVSAAIPAAAPLCRTVLEENLTALVFSPPYFQQVQGANESGTTAEIGTAESDGTTGERTVNAYSGNDISMFLGASIGGQVFGIGMEASARATAAVNFESSTGRTESTSSEVNFGTVFSVDGPTAGLAQFRRRSFDCYEYQLRQQGAVKTDSFSRLCELKTNDRGSTEITQWNESVPVLGATPPPAWTPITREWASLALNGTATSSSGVAANAIDGLINAAPLAEVASQASAYLLIDLGQVQDVHSIRLLIPPNRLTSFNGLRVYAYEVARPTSFVPFGADVSVYDPAALTGGVLPLVTLSTLTGGGDFGVPKRARYLRISGAFTGATAGFALTEVQVFGSARLEPDAYPVAVCDPLRRDGYFQVKQFIRGNTNAYRWIDVAGDADWVPTLGECPAGKTDSSQVKKLPIWFDEALDGGGVHEWFMQESFTTEVSANTGTNNSTRVGAEMDFEAGAVVKIQAGGGYEYTSGMSREESNGTFWSRTLNVGGAVAGIPTAQQICNYRPRPFQYRTTLRSNTGFEHQVVVTDYIVQPTVPGWTQEGGGPAPVCKAPSVLLSDGFE